MIEQHSSTTNAGLSLESLIAWLEKQPPDERYDWTAPCECCIGQWLKATGTEQSKLFCESNRIALESPFYEISVSPPVAEHTFGAALDRARAAQASSVAAGER